MSQNWEEIANVYKEKYEKVRQAAEKERQAAEKERLTAEKERQAAEKERLTAEKERQARIEFEEKVRKENQYGQLANGFPPLQNRFSSNSFASNRNNVNIPLTKDILQSPFGVLDNCSEMILTEICDRTRSDLWVRAANNSLHWCNEASITEFVKLCLHDVLALCNIGNRLTLDREPCLSGVSKLRVDIAALKNNEPYLAGVVEVKVPGNDVIQNPNSEVLNQMISYMVELRNSFGVPFVFLILTNYNHWKIFWFEDTNEYAAIENSSILKNVPATEPTYIDVEQKIKLCHSKLLKRDTFELITYLSSLFYKLDAMSIIPHKFLDTQRMHRCMLKDSFTWEYLPKDFKLNFEIPRPICKTFYVIEDYGRGRDGKVWLGASRSGRLVVLKRSNLECKTEAKLALEKEAMLWKKIWNVSEARVQQVHCAPCLLMPFVFLYCLRSDKLEWRQFFELKNHSKSDDVFQPKFHNDPLSIAEEALKTMTECGYFHGDVEWRHVGLMPRKECGRWSLKPVLVDLSDVKHDPLATQEAKDAFIRDCLNHLKQKLK